MTLFCPVDHDQLADLLKKSVKSSGGPSNGGLDNKEWAAVANRNFSGSMADDRWLGSRAIAAEKANTASKAMATGKLYTAAQPGGFLFGPRLGIRHLPM